MIGRSGLRAAAGLCLQLQGVIVHDHKTVRINDREQEPSGTGISRADFLKASLLTGGAAAAAGILVSGTTGVASEGGRSPKQDRDIMNSLLVLEYLQAAFYMEAVQKGALHGDIARFAHIVARHEQAHVRSLRQVLGSHARQSPPFRFGDTTSNHTKFGTTAMKLEELALHAFVGQGANLTRGAVLHIARIASVEGRHAAWVRDMMKELPAPRAADPGAGQASIAAELRSLGFIKGGAS